MDNTNFFRQHADEERASMQMLTSVLILALFAGACIAGWLL